MSTIIPKHIAIILDGNRRWAKERGLPSFVGHKKGLENFRSIADYCFDMGVSNLTVFAFSTENWKRSKREISYLMKLFKSFIADETPQLLKRKVRLNIMGLKKGLDKELRDIIKSAEKQTANCKKAVLNICLNYGGRVEIVEAVKNIVADKITPARVTPQLLSRYIWSKGQPDPDLIIRTSGEQRLSGFLTWQSVYSELYFTDKKAPELSKKDLDSAIREYNRRQRRFGGG